MILFTCSCSKLRVFFFFCQEVESYFTVPFYRQSLGALLTDNSFHSRITLMIGISVVQIQCTKEKFFTISASCLDWLH